MAGRTALIDCSGKEMRRMPVCREEEQWLETIRTVTPVARQ
jgi:hypothetical protein